MRQTATAAAPVKLLALQGHFKLEDLKGSVWHAGVKQTLQGLGSWPKPGVRYSWDTPRRYMSGSVKADVAQESLEEGLVTLDIDSDLPVTPGLAESTPAAPVTESLSADGELMTLTGTQENLNKVEDNLYTFADMNKKGPEHRLNIIAHGDGTHVYDKGKKHTPQGLFDTLKRNGIFPAHYDNIRILSCYSGARGESSFAAEFQRLTERPVKGYVGEVTARYSAEHITGEAEVVYNSGENPVEIGNSLEEDGTGKEFNPEKSNPYSIFQNPFKWWRFSYKPVVFAPQNSGL